MMTDCETLVLGAQKHLKNDDLLWHFLASQDAAAVRVDISAVSEVTASLLQLLISAKKQRGADGVPMILAGMTEAFREGLVRLGLPGDFFQEERT